MERCYITIKRVISACILGGILLGIHDIRYTQAIEEAIDIVIVKEENLDGGIDYNIVSIKNSGYRGEKLSISYLDSEGELRVMSIQQSKDAPTGTEVVGIEDSSGIVEGFICIGITEGEDTITMNDIKYSGEWGVYLGDTIRVCKLQLNKETLKNINFERYVDSGERQGITLRKEV